MVPDSFIFYTLYYTSYYFPRLSDSIQLFNPSNANSKNGQTYGQMPTPKMVKRMVKTHSNISSAICLSVFDRFVKLALKGLIPEAKFGDNPQNNIYSIC